MNLFFMPTNGRNVYKLYFYSNYATKKGLFMWHVIQYIFSHVENS